MIRYPHQIPLVEWALAEGPLRASADPTEEYTAAMQAVVQAFEGRPMPQNAVELITAAVESAQAAFLYSHPGYAAIRPPAVTETTPGFLSVDAPIGTLAQKYEADEIEERRQRWLATLDDQAKERDARRRREEDSMRRRNRKLIARHADRISPAIAAIWDSLHDFQQYAILKDIHHSVRSETQK